MFMNLKRVNIAYKNTPLYTVQTVSELLRSLNFVKIREIKVFTSMSYYDFYIFLFYGPIFIPLFYSFFSSKVILIHTVFFLKNHA
jgi:hypothetical protein